MARLIPKIDPQSIGLKPERDVAKCLIEKLPDDCIVYHSYPWLKEERNDKKGNVTLREGETDFVVVVPQVGILILEVKGGVLFYDPQDHTWFRQLGGGGKREIKDPFAQAQRNMHTLEEHIRNVSFPAEKKIPCAYGYAVVFPDCEYAGNVPPGADRSIILSTKDLPFLDRRVPEILRKWTPSSRPQPLSKDHLDGLVKALSPFFQLLPVLFRRIEEQEERLFRLTNEQMRVLDILQNHDRVAIEGVAGSGKTLLASAQAQRFVDKGMRVLFVCYNRSLADWIANSLPEPYASKIWTTNFHRLCSKLCDQVSIPFQPSQDDSQQFWRYTAPDLLAEAIQANDFRVDAIVVDEGQDFYPEWWIALEDLTSQDKAPFYIFYDPAQNIFVGDEFYLPVQGPPLVLPTNCRNTRNIAEVCSQIKDLDLKVHADAPVGDQVAIKPGSKASQCKKICSDFIKEWSGRGQLKPSQIVIQSPNKKTNSSLSDAEKISGIPITSSLTKWENDQGILFSTIRGFKGLESDAVILIDVPRPGSVKHFTESDFYVACSRAKHLLVIIDQVGNVSKYLNQ